MKFSIRHAESVVGGFILLAAALLCGILVMVGANQRWFARNYYFHSRFQSGAGISPGTGITLKGFTVGKISKIVLNDNNTVDADFFIFDSYIGKVRKNSVLELATSPLGLGGGLLFYPGKDAERLPEHSYIPSMDFEDGKSIVERELADVPPRDDTLTRLLANINPLVDNINKTVVNVNKTVTTLNGALKGDGETEVGRIVKGIGSTVRGVNGTVADLDSTVAIVKTELPGLVERSNALLDSLKAISGNLEQTTAAMRDPTGLVPKLLDPKGSLKTLLDDNGVLFAKIDAMLSDTDKTIKNVESMTDTLKSSMPEITSLLAEGKTTLIQTQDVLEGLKNNPLLKGGIPERKTQEAAQPGYRDEDF
jgi:phospholipid/cholesterol/gamma-HCH transport system substrate-binding protein